MSNRPEIFVGPEPEDMSETPWAVRASVALLLAQALLFLGLAGVNFAATAVTSWETFTESLLAGEPVLFFILGLLLLTLLAGWAVWRFSHLHRRGWLYAMLTQSFCLLLGLAAYFASKSLSSQVMLLSGIVMTVYLYNPETRDAFHVKDESEEGE